MTRTQVRALRAAGVGGAALALALVAVVHARIGYVGALDTERPFPPPPPREAEALPVPSSERVWVVVVSGLRWREASASPGLAALADDGVLRPLVTDFPSFTAPALTTLVSGLPPVYSGVRAEGESARRLDSVSRRAARRGFAVHIDDGGRAGLAELLQLPAKARPTRAERLLLSSERRRELVWIFLDEVDRAGHRFGAASKEYRAAAAAAGAQVAALAAALDPARDTLVVLSEHGHLDEGGHGGGEPEARTGFLAARGPAVAGRGVLPPAAMRDVAPTLAALLHVAPPRHALGRPLLDVFGLAPPSDDEDARLEDRALESAFVASAAPRLAFALLVALLVVGFALVLHRRRVLRLAWADAAPLALYAGVLLGLLAAAGYRVSWSLPRGPDAFLLETAGFAALALLLALRHGSSRRAAQEAWLGVLALGLPYLVVSAWVGTDPRWLPGPFTSALTPLASTMGFGFWLVFGLRAVFFEATRRRPAPPSGSGTPRSSEPAR